MTKLEIGKLKAMLNKTISPEVYLQTYTSLLDHVAVTFDPVTFIEMLPSNGNMAFYLPYIEKSYRFNCARMLSKHVVANVSDL